MPLPPEWSWLSDLVCLAVLAVLLLVAVVADKVPGVDHLKAATVGTDAPVVSTMEDGASLALSLSALLAPVLVLVALVVSAVAIGVVVRRLTRRRSTIAR